MGAKESTVYEVDLGLPGRYSGKVRENWPFAEDKRVIVTTDRLSAFDRILGVVENKGQVLTELSAWWFAATEDIVKNHLVEVIDPNVSLVLDATPLPVEIVMRSRLTGSTSTSILPRYLAGERVLYGHTLPDGLEAHGALPEVLLTPTTKAQDGEHDSPTTREEVISSGAVSEQLWSQIEKVSFLLFERGMHVAAEKGFILADTKYEFGTLPSGELVLIDEIHTPDSSRYWLESSLEERLASGKSPENFDKEPVRLEYRKLGYLGDGEPPVLPDSVWQAASERYVSIYEHITGQTFTPGDRPIVERIENSWKQFADGINPKER